VSEALRVGRSLIYSAVLYLSILAAGVFYLPFLFGPRRWTNKLVAVWAWVARGSFEAICDVRVEIRGLEYAPAGAALIAAKHQGMFDVIAPFTVLDDPCFVLKKELMWLPIFGWFSWKTGMIPVDREAHAKALKKLVTDTRDRLKDARQIVIFPEGTRTAPGEAGQYKPGVAALYRDLGVPCHLIATNSGVCWPAHGLMKRSGRVVVEFLEPIPAGLKRAQFMAELESRIEKASLALLDPQDSANA
jgi:1-acyl-sn-glycerol-3-phosphate acyltransferase